MINPRTLRVELLSRLKSRCRLDQYAMTGGRLASKQTAEGIVTSIEVQITRAREGFAIDPVASIFWDRFSNIAQHAIADRQPGSVRVHKWKLACLSRTYAQLARDPALSLLRAADASEIAGIVEKAALAHDSCVAAFLEQCSSIAGMARYIQNFPEEVGTWHVLLKFLIREHSADRSAACADLLSRVPRTTWERRQQEWLLRFVCCAS